ncbi:MAG TPA: hypothetical protein VEL07_19810 [Planctomycetota bacterium]|nr:hypothetical protein [Planctomycetota bacterium]
MREPLLVIDTRSEAFDRFGGGLTCASQRIGSIALSCGDEAVLLAADRYVEREASVFDLSHFDVRLLCHAGAAEQDCTQHRRNTTRLEGLPEPINEA